MSYRSNWLSACLAIMLLMPIGSTKAAEYYVDADGYPIDKENIHIDRETFSSFYAVHAMESSSPVMSFFRGSILGFIEGYVVQNYDVSWDEPQNDFILFYSSTGPVFDKMSSAIVAITMMADSNLYDEFTANRDCFSFGITDNTGKIVLFHMYVTDDSYSSYFHCLRKHYATFQRLSSN